MSDFYVYEHWRPDKNECFYVGKGKGVRAYVLKHRKNPYHECVVSVLAEMGMTPEVRLVESGLTEERAFLLEMQRISYWKELGIKLTNATAGGEGVSGMRHSDNAKKRISEAHRGVILSPERKKKISDRMKGRKFSDATIEKMRLGQRERARRNPEHVAAMTELANQKNQTVEAREKRAKSNTGKVRSAEIRERMGGQTRGKRLSEEHRAKLSAAKLGKKRTPHSEETRRKMRDSQRRRFSVEGALAT